MRGYTACGHRNLTPITKRFHAVIDTTFFMIMVSIQSLGDNEERHMTVLSWYGNQKRKVQNTLRDIKVLATPFADLAYLNPGEKTRSSESTCDHVVVVSNPFLNCPIADYACGISCTEVSAI
jgi:hypothetical protein